MSGRDPRVDQKLDRLLSGGRGPSVQEKEAMFEAVLRDLPATPGPDKTGGKAQSPFAWLSLLAAAACAVLFVVVGDEARPDAFTVRGPADRSEAIALHAGCGEVSRRVGASWNTPLSCSMNHPVALRTVRTAPGWSLSVAVFSPDGTLTWVLPPSGVADAQPGPVGTEDVTFALDRLPPGRTTLLATFAEGALSRDAARARFAAHLEGQDAPVVELVLEVKR